MRAVVKERQIAALTLDGEGPTRWAFAVTTSATGLVLLQLCLPDAFVPRSTDQRLLAVGLHSISISEIPDLERA